MSTYNNLKTYLTELISHGLDAMEYVATKSESDRATATSELETLTNGVTSADNGGIPSLANDAAVNGSFFYSTTNNYLMWKDASGNLTPIP